ncbi:outer membrane receptor protein involved in Fe transport [Aquimarina sp. MAR_2010_214]|uniref:TonB-dependent receptor n=1 Tax=Aquimarina sp. MAR_2010_214 TaxID=1250026 RepID=UPI000C6FE18C|nr:carboxypeptidase-like regulatory domain-containing protein [Aquimarina sp. MAR_2010_214]PKV48245.1 outer membrane receptor protein involved in Fe transport [Aquimarina sp. MAR_2010_214]
MKYFFLLLIFLFSLSANAQEKKEDLHYTNISIDTFLTEMEELFDVKFSYNSSSFANIVITIDQDAISLKEIISIISNQYPIHFTQVDERYYIVKLNKTISFCGYLIDKTHTPVEGATIINESRKTGTLSDKKGFFSLKNNSISDTLTISYLGYKTISIPIKNEINKKCDTYILSPEDFVLNEVIIKEYLTSGIVKTRDGSVKIQPNNLNIISGLSEPDILQNIQLLPGIESPLETASGIYIRGGTPDQNLILWDGIKMYNSDHFFGLISAFNPYITKDITIYKSGTQPIYGDRVSGVIDIKTDQNVPEKIQGGLGVNMTHADSYLKFPVSKKFGVLLSARRSITDVIETPTINTYSDRTFQNTNITANRSLFNPQFSEKKELFYFTDVTLKLIANLSEKHNIAISNLLTQNKLDYSFQDIDFVDMSSDQLTIKNFGTNVSWKSKWNTQFSTETQLSYSEYTLEYDGRNLFINQDQTVRKENTIKEYGLLFHSSWNIDPYFTFSNGYQLYSNMVAFYIKVNDSEIRNSKDNPTHSFYSNLQYSSPKNWLINFGVRGSYYSGLQSTFIEPRIYAERKIGKHFRIKGSAEVKNQSISQVIEFATLNFGLENQLWVAAQEDDIPLLRSKQYTLGTLFHKKTWNIEIDTYYKRIKGLTSLTKGFESTFENFSKGKSISKGVDFLIKKKVGKYSTWLSYSISDTEFVFNAINQGKGFKGNNNIGHSFSWSHALQWKKFQFSLGWKYRTGIPYTRASRYVTRNGTPKIIYAPINSKSLPDYHRLDFSVVYDFNWSSKNDNIKSRLGFSLLNLYGRKNILDRSYPLYRIPDSENNISYELREVDKLSLGITPNVTFRLSF